MKAALQEVLRTRRGTHRLVFRWARMEMSPNTIITAPISFDEAWDALSPATQVMLAHLHRNEQQAKQASGFPAVHFSRRSGRGREPLRTYPLGRATVSCPRRRPSGRSERPRTGLRASLIGAPPSSQKVPKDANGPPGGFPLAALSSPTDNRREFPKSSGLLEAQKGPRGAAEALRAFRRSECTKGHFHRPSNRRLAVRVYRDVCRGSR